MSFALVSRYNLGMERAFRKRSIGAVPLGDLPRIAVALTDADVEAVGAAAVGPADLVELRVDMFGSIALEHLAAVFKTARAKFGKPLIATVRDTREGGQREIHDRVSVYRGILPLADAADVEINAAEVLARVQEICRAEGKHLIGSSHHFDATPDEATLDALVEKGRRQGVDIIKIAAMAQGKEDMLRLLLFTLKHRDEGMITMSMGEAGLPSRVLGFLFGSLLTYGYVTKPSAPGQLSIAELADLLGRLRLR